MSDASHEAGWFSPAEIEDLPMRRAQRLRVEHAPRDGPAHTGWTPASAAPVRACDRAGQRVTR